ncbi:unnamed protein product [Tilletia caries]|nr:unnamed protein product [Tilletia caries]
MLFRRRTETEPATSLGGDVSRPDSRAGDASTRQRRRAPPPNPPPSLPLPAPPSSTPSIATLPTPPASSSSISSMAAFHPIPTSTPSTSPSTSQSWTTTSSTSPATSFTATASTTTLTSIPTTDANALAIFLQSRTLLPATIPPPLTPELLKLAEALPSAEDTLRRTTSDAHQARTRALLLHQSATHASRRADALEEQARAERQWSRDLWLVAQGGERDARVAEEAMRQAGEVLGAVRKIAVEEMGKHLAGTRREGGGGGGSGGPPLPPSSSSSWNVKGGERTQHLSSAFASSTTLSSSTDQRTLHSSTSFPEFRRPATEGGGGEAASPSWPQGSATHVRDRTITPSTYGPRIADLDAILDAEQDRLSALRREQGSSSSSSAVGPHPSSASFPLPLPLTPQIGPQSQSQSPSSSPQLGMQEGPAAPARPPWELEVEIPPARAASEFLMQAALMGRTQSTLTSAELVQEVGQGERRRRALSVTISPTTTTAPYEYPSASASASDFMPFSLRSGLRTSISSEMSMMTATSHPESAGGGGGGLGLTIDPLAALPLRAPPTPRLSNVDLPAPIPIPTPTPLPGPASRPTPHLHPRSPSTPAFPPPTRPQDLPLAENTPARTSLTGPWWKETSPTEETGMGVLKNDGNEEVEGDDPLVPYPGPPSWAQDGALSSC